jgi:hypothetical protein
MANIQQMCIYLWRHNSVADLESNFAIAITCMTIVCVILVGFPLACMLANTFRIKRKTNIST